MMTVLTFILIFGSIVTIHELGHFIAAKKSGVLVREFAIGMGPKIFSAHDKQGTLYSIRILPLGGYVRMAAPNEDEYELTPGSTVAIRTDENNEITFITKSKKLIENTFPITISQIDLQDDLYIKGFINSNNDKEVKYNVSNMAMISTNENPSIRIAIREMQLPSMPIWKQIMINFAGPFFNFMLSILVFGVLLFTQGGSPMNVNVVGEVTDNSPAQSAGLQSGDIITKIGDVDITDWDDIATGLNAQTSDTFTVTYTRNNETKTTEVTVPNTENKKLGIMVTYDNSLLGTIKGAFELFITTIQRITSSIIGLFTNFNINDLGGPVAMYELSNQASEQGSTSVFSLLAVLSLNIGLMNLIPIPAFDGGKILLNIIQFIRKKPLQQKTEFALNAISAIALLVLMIAVTWNDVIRSFF